MIEDVQCQTHVLRCLLQSFAESRKNSFKNRHKLVPDGIARIMHIAVGIVFDMCQTFSRSPLRQPFTRK